MSADALRSLAPRARSLLGSLEGAARTDAARVLEIVAALGDEDDVARRIELRGLAERLGRREAEGVPFATLARAASAHLSGAVTDRARILGECEVQLATFGL